VIGDDTHVEGGTELDAARVPEEDPA